MGRLYVLALVCLRAVLGTPLPFLSIPRWPSGCGRVHTTVVAGFSVTMQHAGSANVVLPLCLHCYCARQIYKVCPAAGYQAQSLPAPGRLFTPVTSPSTLAVSARAYGRPKKAFLKTNVRTPLTAQPGLVCGQGDLRLTEPCGSCLGARNLIPNILPTLANSSHARCRRGHLSSQPHVDIGI